MAFDKCIVCDVDNEATAMTVAGIDAFIDGILL